MRSTISLGVALLAAGFGTSVAQAQQVTDWSGFYAGIYAGYALDKDGATSSSTSLDAALGAGALAGSISDSSGRIQGLIGGIEAGYNFQHNNLVLGVETGLNMGQYGKSQNDSIVGSYTEAGDVLTFSYVNSADYNINWYTDLVGTIGVAHGNWLFKLKGGVVVADASINATSSLKVDVPPAFVPPTGLAIDSDGSSSASSILIGPTFGLGVETMVSSNVSISAEYAYIGLPDLSAPAAGIGGLLGAGTTTFTGGIHQAKAGVKYHF